MLDHLRFVLEFGHQRRHVGHLDAGAAPGRLADLEGLDVRRRVHAKVGGLEDFERLLLGFHDVGQRHITWLVQAQVGGDDGRQPELERLGATVDFTYDRDVSVADVDLRGEGGLRQVGQRGEHLAGLVAVVVDRLLAQNHQARLFLVEQHLQQLGHRQRLQFFGGFNQDGSVRADGHGGAQGFLALRDTARHRDHFRDHALLAQPHRLFHGNLVEGVHAHLDVGDVHTAAVGLDANLDVVVDDALDRDEYLHGRGFLLGWLRIRPGWVLRSTRRTQWPQRAQPQSMKTGASQTRSSSPAPGRRSRPSRRRGRRCRA